MTFNELVEKVRKIAGRAAFKDEFVTCGGVSLKAVNPSTLESRHVPHLYFAGEVLDLKFALQSPPGSHLTRFSEGIFLQNYLHIFIAKNNMDL